MEVNGVTRGMEILEDIARFGRPRLSFGYGTHLDLLGVLDKRALGILTPFFRDLGAREVDQSIRPARVWSEDGDAELVLA